VHIALELDDDPFAETTEAHNEAVQNVLSAELQPENPSDVTTTASRSKQNLALCYGNMRNETAIRSPSPEGRGGQGVRTKGAAGRPAAPRRRGRGTARHCPRRIRARPRALSGHQRNRNARARRLRLGDVSPQARRTGVASSHQTTTCGGLATLDGERCRRYADLTRRSPR